MSSTILLHRGSKNVSIEKSYLEHGGNTTTRTNNKNAFKGFYNIQRKKHKMQVIYVAFVLWTV